MIFKNYYYYKVCVRWIFCMDGITIVRVGFKVLNLVSLILILNIRGCLWLKSYVL